MKTSTLTLYYKSLLNKDKNFILDNPSTGRTEVEAYLSTLTSQTISGFQYIKHNVFLTIKLDKSQDALNMGLDAQDLNYIKIQNQGDSPKYYFIVGKNWRSENTIELTLNMDTLNSFEFNRDYELNKKTLVKREHRDRIAVTPFTDRIIDFDLSSSATRSPTYSTMLIAISEFKEYSIEILGDTTLNFDAGYPKLEENYLDGIHVFRFDCGSHGGVAGHVQILFKFRCYAFQREIDMRSEEINAPVYKVAEELLYEKDGKSPASWSLYYKNKDGSENSPVECYLLSDDSYEIMYQTSDGIIDGGDLPANDYVILNPITNGDLSVNVGGGQYYLTSNKGWSWGDYVSWTLLALKKNGANVDVYYAKLDMKVLFFPPIVQWDGRWTFLGTFSQVEVQTIANSLVTDQVASLPTAEHWFKQDYAHTDYTINFSTPLKRAAMTIQDIDRTDPTNIKIIDLPYAPSNFTIDANGAYLMDSMWKTDPSDGSVKLINSNARFKNDVRTQAVNPTINLLLPYDGNADLTNIPRTFKDSKLFHSDFFRPKFVYDSFSRVFPLEKIKFNIRDSYLFPFHFTMSRNIVSKFLFTFDYEYKISTEDFEKVVAVSRNNEEVLYNDAYVNYIRSGYMYDLKAKEKQDIAGIAGIGLNVATIVASVALAVATENPVPLAGAVAGGIGLVGQTINYAKTTAQNEDNIQRKLQETQQQAVAVLNADDVDLLYEYCQNKAKLCDYRVSQQMEDILDDLFYYGGYVTNEQKVPKVNTRYWFNYVQASLTIEESNNLTEEVEKDIKEKFENGVTFLHLRHSTFDFKQEKENIETSVL